MEYKDTELFSIFTLAPITTPQGNIPDPDPINLEQVHRLITSDEKLKKQVSALRTEPDKDKRALIKKSLSYVTVAAVFQGKRKQGNESSVSGLIVTDHDHVNPNETKERINNGPYQPAEIFTSASGQGTKAVFRIDLTAGTHLDFFHAINRYVIHHTGQPIDPTGKDISRACFLSHDPDAIYNPDAPRLGTEFLAQWSAPAEKEHPAPVTVTPAPPIDTTTGDWAPIVDRLIRWELTRTPFFDGHKHKFIVGVLAAANRAGIPETAAVDLLYQRMKDHPGTEKLQKTDFSDRAKSVYHLYQHEHGTRIPGTTDPATGHPSPFDPAVALQQYAIDMSVPMQPPTVYLMCNDVPILTEGNISGIIGQAKSRKTYAVIIQAVAALIGYFMNFKCSVPEINVALFDTEQSPWHARRTVDRIERLAGRDNMHRFKAYALRPLKPEERLAVIEKFIESVDRPTIIFIDGLKDLGYDFNDLHEATKLVGILMRWSYEKPLHIVSVLHTNKGDNTARGHTGQELINKSETILQIDRDAKSRDISTITAKFTRDRDFEPFPFAIDENGLPCLIDTDSSTQGRKQAEIADNFQLIFPGMTKLQYMELVTRYAELAGCSEPTAKRHIGTGLRRKLLKRDNAGLYSLNFANDDIQTEDSEVPF